MSKFVGKNAMVRSSVACLLSALRKDRRGAVAPIFAISSFALIAAIGMSLDYTRLEKARGQLQAGTDGAALTLAMDRAKGLKDTELADEAKKRVSASIPQELNDELRMVGAQGMGTKVLVKSTASVQLSFGAMLGRKEAFVETTAIADYGSPGRAQKVEIALVVGLTGGLNDNGKLSAQKRQTQWYLDKAKENADAPDRIRIALVPYAEQVKLKTAYRNAPWLSFAGKVEKPLLSGQQQSRATSDRSAALHLLLKTKQFQIERMAWNGCVSDTKDPTLLFFDAANQHPGALCLGPTWHGVEANTLEPLSSRFDPLRQRAGAMQAEGCENTTLGLIWGMATLLPQGPFGAAAATGDAQTRKIMILISGAPNAVNRQHGVCIGNDLREPKLDAGTRSVCEQIKRAGVTLYTVNLVGGDKPLLLGCASDGRKYHEAKSAGDLQKIMEQIAEETLSGSPKIARLVE